MFGICTLRNLSASKIYRRQIPFCISLSRPLRRLPPFLAPSRDAFRLRLPATGGFSSRRQSAAPSGRALFLSPHASVARPRIVPATHVPHYSLFYVSLSLSLRPRILSGRALLRDEAPMPPKCRPYTVCAYFYRRGRISRKRKKLFRHTFLGLSRRNGRSVRKNRSLPRLFMPIVLIGQYYTIKPSALSTPKRLFYVKYGHSTLGRAAFFYSIFYFPHNRTLFLRSRLKFSAPLRTIFLNKRRARRRCGNKTRYKPERKPGLG